MVAVAAVMMRVCWFNGGGVWSETLPGMEATQLRDRLRASGYLVWVQPVNRPVPCAPGSG